MRERPATRGLLLRIAWGVVAAILAMSVATPALAAPKPLEVVGKLDVGLPKGVSGEGGPNVALILNPIMRRAYQFIEMDNNDVVGRVYDLESGRRVLERSYERSELWKLIAASPQNAKEWINAVDPQSGTIFLAYHDDNGLFGGLVAVDHKTLRVTKRYPHELLVNVSVPEVDPNDPSLPCTSASCLPQPPILRPSIRGMSVTPSELSGGPPKLLLLFEEQPVVPGAERNANNPWLMQIDIPTARRDFTYRVQSCANNVLPSGQYQVAVYQARLGAGLLLGCLASGGVGQVVRIQLDNNGQPSIEQAFPGPLNTIDVIPDIEADRLALRVKNEEGESFWIFDGGARAYTGVVGATVAPASIGFGIDPVAGRLYVIARPTDKGQLRSTGGLMMSDIRRAPAPQALSFPEFADDGDAPIQVDTHPVTGERRVFLLTKGSSKYAILRDNVPVSVDEAARDLDRLTIDIDEQVGVTGHDFSATGHAYGLRALFVGGLVGVPPTGPDITSIRVGRHGPTFAGSPCGGGDRKLVVGAVRDAELSSDSANAAAAVGETDELTPGDLGEPTGRCYPNPQDPDASYNPRRSLWDKVAQELRGRAGQEIGQYPYPLDTPLPAPINTDEDPKEDGMQDGDVRNDYDELAGMASPFGSTQCSGDDDPNSTRFSVQPLDRGEKAKDPKTGNETNDGPIPDEQRKTEVELERFSADVDCAYSKQRVEAFSELLVEETTSGSQGEPAFQQSVAGLGTIRVGEVSSRVSLYLDPARGLVARSVATVREISIGDDLFIDKAFTLGEAWAKGRSGTAATEFVRRVCGVRLKDQAPDTHVFQPSADVFQENVTADPVYDLEQTPPSVSPNATVNPNATPSASVDPTGGGEVNKNVDLDGCVDPAAGASGSNQPVIDQINRVLGSRGRASVPIPDGELSQGTPGGYLASIQKDRLDKISSTSVNNDNSDQVPALEIILFNDDPNEGRGRQIYQFAGVDATVTYGIYLLNPEEPFIDPGCLFDCEPPVFDPGILPGPSSPPPPNVDLPEAPQGPVTVLFEGINFLFRNPKDALLAAAVWAILFAPVQLSMRRRALKGLA